MASPQPQQPESSGGSLAVRAPPDSQLVLSGPPEDEACRPSLSRQIWANSQQLPTLRALTKDKCVSPPFTPQGRAQSSSPHLFGSPGRQDTGWGWGWAWLMLPCGHTQHRASTEKGGLVVRRALSCAGSHLTPWTIRVIPSIASLKILGFPDTTCSNKTPPGRDSTLNRYWLTPPW